YIDSAFIKNPGPPVAKIPVKYSVKNITNGLNQPILSFLNEENATRDSLWSIAEEIILYKPGTTAHLADAVTWAITLRAPAGVDSTFIPIFPSEGDILHILTNRPFGVDDAFTLQTNAGTINQQAGASLLDNIYVVPNPYVGSSVLEPDNKLPSQNRGERRIYFENLPMECTIRIYTLSGELVTTLEHNEGVDNGREYWNLLNRDGFSVAYGIYIAHIEAPDIGEKLIKFALIK
ncbi:MAG: hypothetical protein Q7S39_03665, partial [Ignavibacteria bacterium]|nr:hypothetical protein [Ignavibacteria bacterium]